MTRQFPRRLARTRVQTTLQPVPLVTTREVADAIGVRLSTVIDWCDRDLLPGAFRLPSSGTVWPLGHWRIPAATLDDLLAGRLTVQEAAT